MVHQQQLTPACVGQNENWDAAAWPSCHKLLTIRQQGLLQLLPCRRSDCVVSTSNPDICGLDFRSCYAPDAAPRHLYVRFGCFVERIDQFDSAAFRLSYVEAAAMDPQCRILLEQTAVRGCVASIAVDLCC